LQIARRLPVPVRRLVGGTVSGVLVVAATKGELVGLDGLVTGIGPVEAAAATTRRIAGARPDAVLNVGLAGSHAFAAPELVIASESRYCDAGSLVPASAAPDAKLVARALAALPDARFCPIGTSARVGGATGCAVEAMEGFAVLRSCELVGVPALELRVTSNDVDEADRGRWQVGEALELLRAALPGLLEVLGA
jgi:nucleoside phosphorylase